jgi:hypothetical protein
MNPSNRLLITETEPTPLLHDFQSFLDDVAANKPYLTPKGNLSGKDLHEMNERMTYPISGTTVRSSQQSYPQLHLFFHLAQAGRLIEKTPGKADKTVLQLSSRVKEYSNLSAPEKYFFLLETFWVDTNWNHIEASVFRGMGILNAQTALKELAGSTPNVPIRARDLVSMPDNLGYLWIYFALFGFWTVTKNEEAASAFKRYFYPEMVFPLPLGIALARPLVKERNFVIWNLPFRRALGEWKVNPGKPLPEEYFATSDTKKGKKPRIIQKDLSGEPFFLPFVPLFAEKELVNTLPRETSRAVDGVYLFRVTVSKGVWRKIELSSNHTLLDLHQAIQDAFDFDSDHLFSFFMDGVPWSDEKFSSPYEDEGPHADEVKIGELCLGKGRTILYLFDYGDEWHFHVTLEEILPDKPHPKKPRIVESKGKNPEQYPDWEE